jgi:hypothetical protein
MLGFVTPPEVSKSFKVPPEFAQIMDVPSDPESERSSSRSPSVEE